MPVVGRGWARQAVFRDGAPCASCHAGGARSRNPVCARLRAQARRKCPHTAARPAIAAHLFNTGAAYRIPCAASWRPWVSGSGVLGGGGARARTYTMMLLIGMWISLTK